MPWWLCLTSSRGIAKSPEVLLFKRRAAKRSVPNISKAAIRRLSRPINVVENQLQIETRSDSQPVWKHWHRRLPTMVNEPGRVKVG